MVDILVFDIETLPGKKYFWRLGDQDWNIESIIADPCVLSFAAKWLFRPGHYSAILTPKEAATRDDRRVVQGMRNLMEKAQIVIAHNGEKFDAPMLNGRYLLHDMTPPSPYRMIDTLLTSRKVFNLPSNKLDYLAQYLGVGRKRHTDYELWKRCDQGDKGALKEMITYNQQDVYILEDVYVKLRPWIKHPNLSMYINTDKDVHVCGHCTSDDIDWIGEYYTDASVFESFRCNNCGAVGRHFKREKTSLVRVVR